jgi:hypothetical protein
VTLEGFRTWIAPISQLLAVIVIAATAVVWGLRLTDKVDRLETQVQTLLTSAPSQSSMSNPPPASNAVACANLAERAGIAAQNMSGAALKDIKQLMSDLGCMTKSQ